MKFGLIGFIVLAVGTVAVAADDAATLKRENDKLRAQNAELKAQISAMSRRLSRIDDEVNSMRSSLARTLQESTDRIARLATGAAVAIARVDPNPRTSNPITTPRHVPTKGSGRPASLPRVNPGTRNGGDSFTKNTFTKADKPRPRIEAPVIKPRVRISRPKGIFGLPTTIAVVDMVTVFESLREKDHVEESLADLVYAVNFQDKKWKQKIRNYMLDRSVLKEGTLAYLEKEKQIDRAHMMLRVDIAAAQVALNRKRGEKIKMLYQKMSDACGRVAEIGRAHV